MPLQSCNDHTPGKHGKRYENTITPEEEHPMLRNMVNQFISVKFVGFNGLPHRGLCGGHEDLWFGIGVPVAPHAAQREGGEGPGKNK